MLGVIVDLFAGSLSYFRHEISLWNEPELPRVYQNYQADTLANQLDKGQDYIAAHSPESAQRWMIGFPTERKPFQSVSWQLPPEKVNNMRQD